MKRRELLQAMGAAMVASVSTDGTTAVKDSGTVHKGNAGQHKSIKEELTSGDSHFLSATNPLATIAQRDLEALALRIVETPEVKKARGIATMQLKLLAGHDVPAEAWLSLDKVMDEYAYMHALRAANSDANYPRVQGVQYGPPHEWFGMKIPGTAGFGGVNPDNNYTLIPLDGLAHFELHGKRNEPAPIDIQFTLTGNFTTTMTVANLDWEDVIIDPDGTFIITFGPEPAGSVKGRKHTHIQTGPDTYFLMVRDVRSDWRQVPNSYGIKRLDPPTAPPLTFQQIVNRTAHYMTEDVAMTYLTIAMNAAQDPNTIMAPFNAGGLGGLVTQMMTGSSVKIADDEAFVVTVGHGGSKYHVLPLYDYWQHIMEIDTRTSTMNSAQSIPNRDDSTTYVISIKDPGVHNWIDTVGLHEPRFWMRWHMSKNNPAPGKGPWIKGQLVKLDELKHVLPAETKWVTPEERRQQLAERLAEFNLRYAV